MPAGRSGTETAGGSAAPIRMLLGVTGTTAGMMLAGAGRTMTPDA